MKWEQSVLWMFVASVVLGYFITSSLLVNSVADIRNSRTKLYLALFMALWMVVIELVMFPQAPPVVWVITFGLIILVGYMARKQVFVDDKQYLQAMIQHHSSAILTSDKILESSQDKEVRELAKTIIESQQAEINLMNDLLEN